MTFFVLTAVISQHAGGVEKKMIHHLMALILFFTSLALFFLPVGMQRRSVKV